MYWAESGKLKHARIGIGQAQSCRNNPAKNCADCFGSKADAALKASRGPIFNRHHRNIDKFIDEGCLALSKVL